MQETITVCDGCGAKMTFGFELSNFGRRPPHVTAFVERTAQFCCLKCLGVWAIKATKSADSLADTARSLQPHGTFHDEDVPALAVA